MNMNLKKAIVAAVATMICSASSNALMSSDQDDNKEKEQNNKELDIIDQEKDSKYVAKDIADNKKDEATTEKSEGKSADKLEKQKKLIEKAKKEKSKSIKHKINKKALESLTSKKFKVTDKTIEDLNKNFNNSKIKLDLFEDDNLDVALDKLVSFSLEEEGSVTGFDIDKNKLVREKMESLNRYLKTDSNMTNKNGKEMEILNRLNDINKEMDKDDLNSIDDFCLSMKAMKDAYSTSISRRTADEILNKNRKKIESHMSDYSADKNVKASLKVGIKTVEAGLAQDIKKSEKSTDNSFYTVSIGGNTRMSFGTDICKAIKADVGENVGITKSIIFNSLEQYLDSGKMPDIICVEGTDINKVLSSRDKMKAKEKKLLSDFNIYIESYLKAVNIIPDSVYVKWPDITKTDGGQKAKTETFGIDSTVSILESLGFKVSVERNSTDIKKSHLYLELLKEDCSPVGVSKSEDIKKFISRVDKKSDKYEWKKYKEVKKLVEEDKQSPSGVASLILGDLRRYNHALSVLSSDREDKEIEDSEKVVKHDIEKRWLSERFKILRKKGRAEMLKSAIIVSTYLRDYANTDEEINLFKSLYEEINRLTKLQEFSKRKKNDKFDLTRTVKRYNVDGKINIDIPSVGDVNATLTYSNIKGAPFESGKEINFSIRIPSNEISRKVVDKVLDKISALDKKLSENDSIDLNSEIIQASFGLLENIAIPSLNKLGFNVPTGILDKINVKEYSTISFNMRNIEKNNKETDVIPLPSSKLIIRDRDKMALKYVRRTDLREAKIDLNAADCLDVKATSQRGKNNSYLGDDTLSFIINRYNVFAMGQEDRKGKENEKSDLWIDMRENNKNTFKNIVKNVSKEDSNVRYELQNMYNSLMKRTKNNGVKTNCERKYKEFLDACDNLSAGDENQYESAFILLDDILNLNYKYVFLPQYNREFH